MFSQPMAPAAAKHAAVGAPLSPPVLVDSAGAFERMLAALARQPRLALDTESDSLYRYFYKVCLLQISTPDTDYLVDPLRLSDLAPLNNILADSAVQKVFHAAENDILMLKRDFGFSFANVFDTMLAARILGWKQVSLAALLETHFGVTLDKRAQLTDWGHRPLTGEQLSYARLDTHHLLALCDLLEGELNAQGRQREARDAFAGLPRVTYIEKPFDPDGFWRMREARDLQGCELAVLRQLYLWRDEQARKLNRPVFKVLGDDRLILMARRRPMRLADLPLSPHQIELFGRGVLAVIAVGCAAPTPTLPPRPANGNGRPTPEAQARFDQLRGWRSERAAVRQVDADLILTNDALMTIARAAPTTMETLEALGVMGAWKLEEYGADVLRLIANTRTR